MDAFSICEEKYPIRGQLGVMVDKTLPSPTQLPLDIVESPDLLGEGALKGRGVGVELSRRGSAQTHGCRWKWGGRPTTTHISELHLADLAQGTDNLTANLGGDVQLGQGHVRRAEQRIPLGRHDGEGGRCDPDQAWYAPEV